MLIRLKSKREKGKGGGDQRIRSGLTPSQPHKFKRWHAYHGLRYLYINKGLGKKEIYGMGYGIYIGWGQKG